MAPCFASMLPSVLASRFLPGSPGSVWLSVSFKLFTGRVKVFYIRFHFTFTQIHTHTNMCLSVECTSLDVTPKSHSIFMHITHTPLAPENSAFLLRRVFPFFHLRRAGIVRKCVGSLWGKDWPTCLLLGNLIEIAPGPG